MKISLDTSTARIYLIAFLALAVLAYRLPYWFVDVVNWDETTFAIMAQGIVNGVLPYTELWDLKPPLAFAQISIFLAIFGENIVAVRLASAVYVFASVVLLFLIADRLFDRLSALLAGTLLIALCSLYWLAQATMTEHLAMLPVTGALYLLICYKLSLRVALAVGFLLSVAVLTRLNLAYLVLATGVLILVYSNLPSPKGRVLSGFAYATGGMIPVVLVLGLYLATGNIDVLKASLVDAPLAYATQQNSTFGAMRILLAYLFPSPGSFPYFSLIHLVAICALPGLVLMFHAIFRSGEKPTDGADRKALVTILTFFFAIGYSIVSSGGGYGHYLLQVAPFFALFTAAVYFHLARSGRVIWANGFAAVLVAFGFLGWAKGPLLQVNDVVDRVVSEQRFMGGLSYWVEDLIAAEGIEDYSVFALNHHVVYFNLKKSPPIPIATHPSSLFKPFLVSALTDGRSTVKDELLRILSQEPTYIVKSPTVWYMEPFPEEKAMLENFLGGYTLLGERNGLQVYRNRDAK